MKVPKKPKDGDGEFVAGYALYWAVAAFWLGCFARCGWGVPDELHRIATHLLGPYRLFSSRIDLQGFCDFSKGSATLYSAPLPSFSLLLFQFPMLCHFSLSGCFPLFSSSPPHSTTAPPHPAPLLTSS